MISVRPGTCPLVLSGMSISLWICFCPLTKPDFPGSSDLFLWCDIQNELDFYFLYGPEFDQIFQGFHLLTGKVPLLPRWIFGYLQSKERYHSQAVAKKAQVSIS